MAEIDYLESKQLQQSSPIFALCTENKQKKVEALLEFFLQYNPSTITWEREKDGKPPTNQAAVDYTKGFL